MRAELEGISLEVALRRGLGRAILFLEEQTDCRPYRELLLEACLNNWAYDRQIEDNRAAFLFDAIHATGEPEYYASHIRHALLTPDLDCARGQVIDISGLLARSDTPGMRPALYQAFPQSVESGYAYRCEHLIRLDGIQGYIFVAEVFREKAEFVEDWEHTNALGYLAEVMGEEPPVRAMEMVCILRPDLSSYVQETFAQWQIIQQIPEQKPASSNEPATYGQVKSVIVDSSERKGVSRSWIRTLDDAAFLQLAQEVVTETDTNRLWHYLDVFRKRPYPLDPCLLLPLIHHGDEFVRRRVSRVLSEFTHPAIRECALELLRQPAPDDALLGLILLPSNPGPDDITSFQCLLNQAEDDDIRHNIILPALEYLEHQFPDGSTELLLEIYTQSPCTICRLTALEMLSKELPSLPAGIIEEARYDAYHHTRQFVESYLSKA